ncbi:MAG TPA: beta-N-acetylhexosaminidase [Acidaminococcaceae bacterium]|nr:beta-N-acetylhexosaminidase [Acidaminococcaceae bacterium]
MKKKILLCSILCLLFLIAGCSAAEKNTGKNETATQPAAENWNTEKGIRELSAALTEKMSLEEKIGQMMFVGIHGTTLTEETKSVLSSMHVGGVILFDRNMEKREQVQALNASVQSLKLNYFSIPLFLSVDQEGGLVTRMKHDAYTAPSATEIGKGKPEDAYRHANKTGIDIKELGFNLDFAPVLDTGNRMRGRTYGATPPQVALFGEQACRGLRDSGVLFTIKHFPGMGRSETDPHTEKSVVNVSRETILQEDLQPFRQIIDQYPHDQFMVMAGHIRYPAFDTKPASLSPVILKDLLRNQLGYRGVVITDDLNMGAVSEGYSPEEIGIIAIQAGSDILLSCHDPQIQQRTYKSVVQAVKDGKISQSEINASVQRILYCKLKNLMSTQQRKAVYEQIKANSATSKQ